MLIHRRRAALWLAGVAWACVVTTACGKVATTAGKTARSVGKSQITKRVLTEAAGTAVSYFGEEILHQQRMRHQGEARADFPVGERFPNPGLVQVVYGTQPYFDASTRLFVQPNNFGGWSYFAENRQPVGFSAFHRPSGRLHYFDPYGRRLQ